MVEQTERLADVAARVDDPVEHDVIDAGAAEYEARIDPAGPPPTTITLASTPAGALARAALEPVDSEIPSPRRSPCGVEVGRRAEVARPREPIGTTSCTVAGRGVMTSTRSASCTASSMSCVTNRTVLRSRCQIGAGRRAS